MRKAEKVAWNTVLTSHWAITKSEMNLLRTQSENRTEWKLTGLMNHNSKQNGTKNGGTQESGM